MVYYSKYEYKIINNVLMRERFRDLKGSVCGIRG